MRHASIPDVLVTNDRLFRAGQQSLALADQADPVVGHDVFGVSTVLDQESDLELPCGQPIASAGEAKTREQGVGLVQGRGHIGPLDGHGRENVHFLPGAEDDMDLPSF